MQGVKRAGQRAPRQRLSSDARRRQILGVAARVMTDQGLERVQVTEVADAAGISRPVVYRFFPTRQALVVAVLEDFIADLEARFRAAAMTILGGTFESITRAFIEASCDAITAKGAGPWRLLDARGADPELGRIGREMQERMLAPWRDRIGETTGLEGRDVLVLARVVVAAGRAALDEWIERGVSRARAVDAATRAVTILLLEFGRPASPTRARR